MPRIFPFANALRLRKGINYPIPEKEGIELSLLLLPPWVDLTNKYTSLDLPEYSILDMISRYISGEIQINASYPDVSYKKGQIEILSLNSAYPIVRKAFVEDHTTNEFLMAFLVDDVVYDKADSWYLLDKGEPVSKEMLFHYQDKAMWYRPILNRNDDIVKACTQEFIDFCFKELGKREIYKILPSNYIDENLPQFSETKIIGVYTKGIYHGTI